MPEKQSPPPVILITGAGKGIGRAVAETLSSRARTGAAGPGVKLLLAARTASDLEALRSRLEGGGVECGITAGDLADQPLQPIEACLARFGRIDALVHCAGVGRFKDLLEQTPEDLEFTIRTNITATFLLLQKTYAAMKAQAPRDGLRGQIQVVTSIAHRSGRPHQVRARLPRREDGAGGGACGRCLPRRRCGAAAQR